jgi:hypothetical protein
MKARTQTDSATAIADCCHHWVLGAPQNGEIKASCRNCGRERVYPAVLDDLDPKAEQENGQQSGVGAGGGGGPPSSVASPSTNRTSPAKKVQPRLSRRSYS